MIRIGMDIAKLKKKKKQPIFLRRGQTEQMHLISPTPAFFLNNKTVQARETGEMMVSNLGSLGNR